MIFQLCMLLSQFRYSQFRFVNSYQIYNILFPFNRGIRVSIKFIEIYFLNIHIYSLILHIYDNYMIIICIYYRYDNYIE